MNRHVKTLRLIGFFLGVVIFVVTIQRFGGVGPVWLNLKQVGGAFAFVLVNSFGWTLSYTLGWLQMFQAVPHSLSFFSLLKIKMAGEGVNFMTPLGFMAGDPVRVLMLRKFTGPDARLRSVVLDRVMHSLSAQVFCLIGILLIFTQDIDFPFWMHVVLIVIYVTMLFVLLSLVVSLSTGHGFWVLNPLFKLLQVERRFPKLHDKLVELKTHLEHYKNLSKMPFWVSFFCHFLGRCLGAVEIMIVFYALTGDVNVWFCIILTALTSFIAFSFGFIPGAFGVLEAMYAGFATLYGFTPGMGITLQIVRRLRVFFWIVLGIILADYHEISQFFQRMKRD